MPAHFSLYFVLSDNRCSMLCLELGCSLYCLFTAMSGAFCKGKGEGRGVALHSSVRHEGVASQPCRVGGRKGGGGGCGAWGRAFYRSVRRVGEEGEGVGLSQHSHGGGEGRGGRRPLHRLVKHAPPTDCQGDAHDRIWIDRA